MEREFKSLTMEEFVKDVLKIELTEEQKILLKMFDELKNTKDKSSIYTSVYNKPEIRPLTTTY